MLLRLIGILLIMTLQTVYGQYMSRQLVAVTGSSAQFQGFLIQQAIGEPVISRTITNGSTKIRQGFLQSGNSHQQEFELHASLYPNPGNGSFTVETNISDENPLTILITDAAGKIIAEGTLYSGYIFNAGSLASGTYLIQISALEQRIVLPYIVSP